MRTDSIKALAFCGLTCIALLSCQQGSSEYPERSALLDGLPQDRVLDLSGADQGGDRCFIPYLELVTLKGKVNHFGMDVSVNPPEYLDWDATVSGVKVWIAEYPVTKKLNLVSDDEGLWTLYVIKPRGQSLSCSFVYEKEGWVTTKSNVISIGDEDRTDLAIQFIDPLYYRYAVNPMVESLLGSIAGSPQTLERAIVTTVGKSWASIYHRQTHGVPGAQALLLSDATVDPIGPVYFNDRSQPDPSQAATSRDGGVCWFNPADGAYSITAQGGGFTYSTVHFNVTPEDALAGIALYIATPPDAIISSDDSGYIPVAE